MATVQDYLQQLSKPGLTAKEAHLIISAAISDKEVPNTGMEALMNSLSSDFKYEITKVVADELGLPMPPKPDPGFKSDSDATN